MGKKWDQFIMINIRFIRLSIRPIVLGVAAFLLTVSCGTYSTPSSNLEVSSVPRSDCRLIQHAMGETCVPLNLQRIVTIDPFSLENVLALGIKPTGYAISPDWLEKRDYLRDRLAGVDYAGDHRQPSLESILALNPDLILGLEVESEAIYRQLEQIAPTVLFPFETSGQWKDILRQNADALGKANVANERLAEYEARLDDFKTQMNVKQASLENPAESLEVSVVRVYPNALSIYSSDTFIGTIIEDAGLSQAAVPTQSRDLNISKENLSLADGDVIFLWSNESGQSQQEVETEIANLKDDPLWQQLNAVQTDRVYQVPSYWIGSSILTAHAVIDDLFNYLLETQP